MSDRDEFGAFLVGFIVGGLSGAVVALLFAPQSGEETRTLLKERSIEIRDRAASEAEEAWKQAEEAALNARLRAEELTALARTRGEELASQARARGEEIASQARSRSEEITLKARERGKELVETAKKATGRSSKKESPAANADSEA